MQTRGQAKTTALAAVAQAVVQSLPFPLSAPDATKNPPVTSVVSNMGPAQSNEANLLSMTEEETEDEYNDEKSSDASATAARAFGVPQFIQPGGQYPSTPVRSQSDYYPAEVFKTPRAPKPETREGRIAISTTYEEKTG
ncbi:hypothetical protein B0H13DRAFT_1851395 [Mycena leptocephala]|nr:hypothetical protein B0H13DRAFT_1851395 [Mycena leptocephala]